MMLRNNGELEERKVFSLQNCMQKSFARVNTHSFLGESTGKHILHANNLVQCLVGRSSQQYCTVR